MTTIEDFTIEDFINSNMNTTFNVITQRELEALREEGHAAEELISHLASKFGLLIHGSQRYTPGHFLPCRRNTGRITTFDDARVAMFRAIVNPHDFHPLELAQLFSEGTPETVCLKGVGINVIRPQGYVCLVRKDHTFFNFPEGSCQYVSYEKHCQIFAKIDISRKDLPYNIANSKGEVLG
jgi:hypothetical protein